jgi:nucleoid-associated protein YgaU
MYVRTDMKSGAACYTVQSGDSLSTISQKFYGTQSAAGVQKIYYSNTATIGSNPNVIYPGQKLYIPD